MTKTCAEIFEGLPCTVLGDANVPVSGLAYRSDAVQPGDAFFCIVGQNVDGHTFAQDAIDRGASVLVCERKVYLADATDVTEVVCSDSRCAMAHAACRFWNDPSDDFQLVGITGTNGKTTTTYLVEHICAEAGKKTGVIGTVGVVVDGVREASAHTTPESPDLQRTFARMRDAGCEAVVMEVSSHALDLERVAGAHFAVTAFTNLTQDHLDYHHTFEAYFDAKAKLFGDGFPAKRVICTDDAWGVELARRCREAGDDVIAVGDDAGNDIHPVAWGFTKTGTSVRLAVHREEISIEYPLVGAYNVQNVMVALGIAMQLGIPVEDAAAALSTAHGVPGRLQRVTAAGADASQEGDVTVYVDYAHTPDALTKALACVREIAGDGRVAVVFGCGGDRDAAKRPIMGKAALAADRAIVTSDNPRSEDPAAIIADITAGMEAGAYEVVPDRAAAIRRAIDAAAPGDCVLIAGKGHEDYQIIGKRTIHFDDREVAAEALAERAAR